MDQRNEFIVGLAPEWLGSVLDEVRCHSLWPEDSQYIYILIMYYEGTNSGISVSRSVIGDKDRKFGFGVL